MRATVKNSAYLLAVLFLLSAVNITFAQGKKDKEKKEEIKEKIIVKDDDNENCHKQKGMFGIKGLTDDQKEKMNKLRTAKKKDMLQYRNQIAEKKARLKTLETADVADMNAINKTIEELGVIKTDMMKRKAAHKQEIRKLLNEEQRLEFDLRAGKEKGFGKHKMDRKHGKRMKVMKFDDGGDCDGVKIEKEIEIEVTE